MSPTPRIRSILLVDDTAGRARRQDVRLTRAGHEVTRASSLSEALHLMTFRSFDGLVVANELPDGPGVVAVASFRRTGGEHAVLRAGSPTAGDYIDAFDAGANALVPFEDGPRALVAHLAEASGARRPATAASATPVSIRERRALLDACVDRMVRPVDPSLVAQATANASLAREQAHDAA